MSEDEIRRRVSDLGYRSLADLIANHEKLKLYAHRLYSASLELTHARRTAQQSHDELAALVLGGVP